MLLHQVGFSGSSVIVNFGLGMQNENAALLSGGEGLQSGGKISVAADESNILVLLVIYGLFHYRVPLVLLFLLALEMLY
jgi:hypothetical protein